MMMATAYEIHKELEAATTDGQVYDVIRKHAADIEAMKDVRPTDYAKVKQACLDHMERVSGVNFTHLFLKTPPTSTQET